VRFLRGVEDRLDPDSRERIGRNPLRVLDSKNLDTQELLRDAPRLPDHLGPEARTHFDEVQALLDAAGVRYRLVPNLVRGLDYYSRTAFEIQSEKLGAQSQVCGGGRYDGLVQELGGPPVPAVGWALGLERLAIVLEQTKGPAAEPGPDAFLVAMGDEAKRAALVLARDLRRAGVRCDLSFAGGGFGRQFKAADRRGARWAVVLGEDEMRKGTVSVKDLRSGEQEEVGRDALADRLLRGAERR
jgi:histidyl-tRNA synthetase